MEDGSMLDRSPRAVSVRAGDGVWPWMAQLGQGRGGFYSYDALENLAGCHTRWWAGLLVEPTS
jgi:hypothetical protein